jgi:hypothetical protein
MNRFLVPAVVAALVAGCARPDMFGLQQKQLVVVDSAPVQAAAAPTVIVRDIYHETPVVQVDTVYMEEPVPAEQVYIEQDYETYVYVSEPPPPRPHNPRWSPRQQEPRQSRPPRDRDELRPPSGQPVPEPPKVIVPPLPTRKTYAPVTDGRQKSPDRPTPPDQLVPPKRQAPAQGGSAPAAPVQHESPKQVPTPPTDKSAGVGFGA